jgi:archaellum component FlaF (FlaF/FlaG flagellin family)
MFITFLIVGYHCYITWKDLASSVQNDKEFWHIEVYSQQTFEEINLVHILDLHNKPLGGTRNKQGFRRTDTAMTIKSNPNVIIHGKSII